MTGTNTKRIPGPGGAARRLAKGESSEAIPKFAIGTKVRKVRSKGYPSRFEPARITVRDSAQRFLFSCFLAFASIIVV